MFCLYLVPTEALAAELRTGSGNSQNAYARDTTASDSADIVSEIVSSRDKYQKEYILSNGQRLLTIYPTAVHYEDEDGLWQEIDNTLCTASVNGKSVYRNTAGIWDVTLPSSLSGNDAVSLSRGDSTLRFRFAGQLLQDDVLTAQLAQMSDTAAAEEILPEETAPVDETTNTDEQTSTEETQQEAVIGVEEESSAANETSAEEESETATVTSAASENSAVSEENESASDLPIEPETETTQTSQEQTIPTAEETANNVVTDNQWETATTTRMGDTVFGRTQAQTSQIALKESAVEFSQGDRLLQQSFSDKLSSAAVHLGVQWRQCAL